MENDLDEKIVNMVLMDVLLSENDLGIIDNSECGSKFNLELMKVVVILNEWKDKVDVKYSIVKNFKCVGVFDKYMIYLIGLEFLVDNVEVMEVDWLIVLEV